MNGNGRASWAIVAAAALLARIAGLLRTAGELGISTSLDPQWDASGRWRHMDEWLPLLTYLFVNHDEALSITGAPSSSAATRAPSSVAVPTPRYMPPP